jgi:hypothetical protein
MFTSGTIQHFECMNIKFTDLDFWASNGPKAKQLSANFVPFIAAVLSLTD